MAQLTIYGSNHVSSCWVWEGSAQGTLTSFILQENHGCELDLLLHSYQLQARSSILDIMHWRCYQVPTHATFIFLLFCPNSNFMLLPWGVTWWTGGCAVAVLSDLCNPSPVSVVSFSCTFSSFSLPTLSCLRAKFNGGRNVTGSDGTNEWLVSVAWTGTLVPANDNSSLFNIEEPKKGSAAKYTTLITVFLSWK